MKMWLEHLHQQEKVPQVVHGIPVGLIFKQIIIHTMFNMWITMWIIGEYGTLWFFELGKIGSASLMHPSESVNAEFFSAFC